MARNHHPPVKQAKHCPEVTRECKGSPEWPLESTALPAEITFPAPLTFRGKVLQVAESLLHVF